MALDLALDTGAVSEKREKTEKKAERRGEDNATPAVGSRGRDEKNDRTLLVRRKGLPL